MGMERKKVAVNLTESPDVVVVGGGIVGVAVGEALVREGLAVWIVEGRGVGSGATGASAGMLAPLAEAVASVDFERDLVRAFDELVEDVDRLEGVERYPSGLIHVPLDREDVAFLETMETRYQKWGWPVERLSPQEVRSLCPSLDVQGPALLSLKETHVHPEHLIRAYADSFKRRGGKILLEKVQRVDPHQEFVEVHTLQRTIRARWGVLAAGAWSGRLLPRRWRSWVPVFPVRGQMIAYQGVQVPWIVWTRRGYALPKGRFQYVGATVERVGFREHPTQRGKQTLMRLARRLFPGLKGAPESVWAGLRPASPDELPILGRVGDTALVVATGHYRNGILLSSWTARWVVRILLGGERLDRYDPLRFVDHGLGGKR